MSFTFIECVAVRENPLNTAPVDFLELELGLTFIHKYSFWDGLGGGGR